jgi:hypothetical protein
VLKAIDASDRSGYMPDMEHKLEPWQEEIVEEELAHIFSWEWREIAKEFGIEPPPGDDLSDENFQRIVAEIDHRHRKLIMDRFLDSATMSLPDPAIPA